MACFSGRVCTNAVSIFSLPLLKFSIGSRSAFLGVELRLTHAVTHEQTGRKQWNGECLRVIESRVGNPCRYPPYTLDPQ